MAVIFYVLGCIGLVIGGFLTLSGLFAGSAGTSAASFMLLGVPGISTIISSLLLLAVGGVLTRLDRIIENTALNYGEYVAPQPGGIEDEDERAKLGLSSRRR